MRRGYRAQVRSYTHTIDHGQITTMRTFTDNHGKRWQAALLDASYGNIVLVFSPLQGDGIRQRLLEAENLAEGEAQLAGLDDDDLLGMLDDAAPWDTASGGF